MQARIAQRPDILDQRRETVEHPFGTIKLCEPGCVSDARVGEGARRVQPDRAGLQSPARSQYRGVPRLDGRAPGLKNTLEAVLSPKSATFGL